MRRITFLLAAAAAALSAGAAEAASVEIKDAMARVTVIPEDRADVKVEVTRASRELPLVVRQEGGRTVVDGGLHRRIQDCDGMDSEASVKVRGLGRIGWEEMPQVVIRTPRKVSLSAGGAVSGVIGRSASLSMRSSGCSAWTIADVSGEAELDQSGAGRIRMGQAGRLGVRLSGAANIAATRVRGLDARISGAGNIQVQDISGAMDARVSGVGQVRVAEGRASTLRASVSGIGQVSFGGQADSLDASISGLGSVKVRQVNGPVRKSVSGGGRVSVGEI